MTKPQLSAIDRETYEWQMWVPGFGETGQQSLKGSTALITRVGGVGSAVAYYLAAAGVGRLILCHGGDIKQSDLHRQILMTQGAVGTSRVECAARRLKELNPRIEIVAVAENIAETNAHRLASIADVLIDCAPLFQERLALNRAAVSLRKPMVDCSMYELEAQITTVIPGQSACLACLYPTPPENWKRQFPVFGAVAGMIGSLGAMEAIKILSGLGSPLSGKLWRFDLRDMTTREMKIDRNKECLVCGAVAAKPPTPAQAPAVAVDAFE